MQSPLHSTPLQSTKASLTHAKNISGAGLRVGIVVSRFNAAITQKLLQGALETLESHGVSSEHLRVVWVPGAFELPLIAKTMAASGAYHAIITLGCVIRGETDHYEYVCQGTVQGISQAALETGVPVILGVLTTDTEEQALARTGMTYGNKGSEAAEAALEMANLLSTLPQ